MAQAAKSRTTAKPAAHVAPIGAVDLASATNDELIWLMDFAERFSDLVTCFINQPRCQDSAVMEQLDHMSGEFHTAVGEALATRAPATAWEARQLGEARIVFALACGDGMPGIAALAASLALPLKN